MQTAPQTRLRNFILICAGFVVSACSDASVDSAVVPVETDSVSAEQPIAKTDAPQAKALTTRSAERHTHGGAVLSVAAEKQMIVMELDTPLFNLVGFEYAPTTPEEQARVEAVETRLSAPETLFRFNAEAGCSYIPPAHSIELFESAHDDHSDHAHEADHKDVILKYELRCKALPKLKTLDGLFFNDFPYFKALELVYLGPSQQMSVELSPSRPSADLTR